MTILKIFEDSLLQIILGSSTKRYLCYFHLTGPCTSCVDITKCWKLKCTRIWWSWLT